MIKKWLDAPLVHAALRLLGPALARLLVALLVALFVALGLNAELLVQECSKLSLSNVAPPTLGAFLALTATR